MPAEPRLPDDLPARTEPGPPMRDEDLSQLTLDGAVWTALETSGLRLDEVLARRVELREGVLHDCRLSDVIFAECNLSTLELRGGSLRRVLVEGGRHTGLRIVEAELSDVVVRDCRMDLAAFQHATLERVAFERCDLRQSDFVAVRGRDLRFADCDLGEARFSRSELATSSFSRCRMEDLSGVESLRGTAMGLQEVLTLAPQLAATLGISLTDD
jgi:uncharacterized protein YjbI with pentapeptide repeats